MSENERQQRMVERIQEDERLRGDLEDDAATALIGWAAERASAAAADPARPDEAVEADVQALRRAVRAAAASGETDPAKLIDLAAAALGATPAQAPASASEPQAPAPEPPASAPPERQAPAPEQPAPEASEQRPPAPEPAAAEPARPKPSDRGASGQTGAAAKIARSKRGRGRMSNFLKRLRGGR